MRSHIIVIVLMMVSGAALRGEQRRQDFSHDPEWEGLNNRLGQTKCRTCTQDFGYSAGTNHAGGGAGEIGGIIQMSGEPAYYAMRLPKPLSLNDPLSASGSIAFPDAEIHGPLLIGFFNSKNSVGWRTRNSLATRLDNRGNGFHAHIEYATDRWRTGADLFLGPDAKSGKKDYELFPLKGVHHWAFSYDPKGNNGGGSIAFSVDDHRLVMNLEAGHKADGAVFDRFGVLNVMKSVDNTLKFYLDDLTVNEQREDFSSDPGWDGLNNRRKFEDCLVRPRFNFGFSPTHFAGGSPGELGGVVFRGDDRYPLTMAYYGDRVEPLTLSGSLKASGRVALTRGISDSTALLGWFHSEVSLKPSHQDFGLPRDFLGVMVEGPSSDGFFFRPAFRSENKQAFERGPVILPDGKQHQWELQFVPKPGGREGTITVSLDGKSAALELGEKQQLSTARFNRFGIITTCIDGNYQFLYFDDLEYTFQQ